MHLALVLDPLAVGRVRDEEPVFLRMRELLYVPLLKMNILLNPRRSRIVPCVPHGARVDVKALQVGSFPDIGQDRLLGRPAGLPEGLCGDNAVPALRRELAFKPRRNIGRHHGRLDEKCPGSAERVHQDPPAPPGRELDEGSRQRLRDRRDDRRDPVAALVEGGSAHIDPHGHEVLLYGDPERVGGTVLRQPLHPVMASQPGRHGFLHDSLDVRGREERTLDGRGLGDPELCVPGQKILERERFRPLEELVIGSGLKLSDPEERPLRGPKADVGRGSEGFISGKYNPPVVHRHDISAEVGNLSFQYCLQTEVAGGDIFKVFHLFSIFC